MGCRPHRTGYSSTREHARMQMESKVLRGISPLRFNNQESQDTASGWVKTPHFSPR